MKWEPVHRFDHATAQVERDQVKWEPVHRFDHATTQDSGAGAIPQKTILLQAGTRTVAALFRDRNAAIGEMGGAGHKARQIAGQV
ncbi:hypothetical protein GCM10017621_19070 [Maricaulis virginensis]|uniref:Uncharacterized protein n=1 Tax=Maricaulis virginensis TaxID=144022 RepID=A0A9W6IMR8_9PROT|nr:hypothetical protein GCM10017621_19070 [Maricaulis virginensis]